MQRNVIDLCEKKFMSGVQALEKAPRGAGHGCRLLMFKTHLDNTLRYVGLTLTLPFVESEVDSMILVGPCQFRIFYASMNYMAYIDRKY